MAQQINAYVEESLHALVTRQAKAENRSISSVVEQALIAYVVTDEAEARRDQAEKLQSYLTGLGG